MKLIDLTMNFGNCTVEPYVIPLQQADGTKYNGMCSHVRLSSMTGSYIDFPGHIDASENGRNAVTADMTEYYRQPAAVVRPVPGANGEVSAEALAESARDVPSGTRVLVINALGGKEVHDVPSRSIYLSMEAADWLIKHGFRIVVSDIWEKKQYEGIFYRLFQGGIDCVCIPAGLSRLPDTPFFISIIFLPIPETVQTPCRILAEIP